MFDLLKVLSLHQDKYGGKKKETNKGPTINRFGRTLADVIDYFHALIAIVVDSPRMGP